MEKPQKRLQALHGSTFQQAAQPLLSRWDASNACMQLDNGDVKCWGDDQYGQDGKRKRQSSPIQRPKTGTKDVAISPTLPVASISSWEHPMQALAQLHHYIKPPRFLSRTQWGDGQQGWKACLRRWTINDQLPQFRWFCR